jgi:hypothetical protein
VRAEWRRAAIGAGVLALHALLALVLIRMQFTAPTPPQAEHEITLLLMPAPKPPKREENKTPAASTPATRTAPAFSLPKEFTSPNAITEPESHALDGVGASLGCGASNYDALDKEHRAQCGNGPWAYNKEQRETAALIIKAPPRGMTPMERAERIRSTADPCGAEKLTHQVECIHHVIYGDKLP